jgi:hypothetical protein
VTGGGAAALIPRAPLLVALALASAVAAPLYVVSGDLRFAVPAANDERLARAQLWFLLVGLQAAVWAMCAVHVVAAAGEIWRRYAGPVRRILVDVVLPTGLLAGVLCAWHLGAGADLRPDRLGGLPLNRGVPVAVFGIAVAVAAVAGMFLARLALVADRETAPPALAAYAFFAPRFHVFLYSAALILSLGILGSAALRSAMNAEKRAAGFFPAEYVILYGGMFTVLLLIAYVPVKTAFWRYGAELVDLVMGPPPTSRAELVKWVEDRATLQRSLDLDLSTASALLGVVAAGLPLLCGWVSVLLACTKP